MQIGEFSQYREDVLVAIPRAAWAAHSCGSSRSRRIHGQSEKAQGSEKGEFADVLAWLCTVRAFRDPAWRRRF